MSGLGKAAKDGMSAAAGKMLGDLLGTTKQKPKRPYTLFLKIHLNATNMKSIGRAYDKIKEKLRTIEEEGGDATAIARNLVCSFFGITEEIDVVKVVDAEVKMEHA